MTKENVEKKETILLDPKQTNVPQKPIKEEIVIKERIFSNNSIKKKYYKEKTYKNGVKKSELLGMEKNGKMIWGAKK